MGKNMKTGFLLVVLFLTLLSQSSIATNSKNTPEPIFNLGLRSVYEELYQARADAAHAAVSSHRLLVQADQAMMQKYLYLKKTTNLFTDWEVNRFVFAYELSNKTLEELTAEATEQEAIAKIVKARLELGLDVPPLLK